MGSGATGYMFVLLDWFVRSVKIRLPEFTGPVNSCCIPSNTSLGLFENLYMASSRAALLAAFRVAGLKSYVLKGLRDSGIVIVTRFLK